MLVANFKGRRNARRITALARNQESLKNAETHLTRSLSMGREDAGGADYYLQKVQRIRKAIANTEAKVMPQNVAESLRTKKNRTGFSRQRSQ